MLSEDLVAQGKRHYTQGEYSKAIHEFSKALLADPEDTEAKKYLNKMGLADGIYQSQVSVPEQFSELSQEITAYQDRLTKTEADKSRQEQKNQALEAENIALQETAVSQGAENAALRKKLDQDHERFEQQQKENEARLKAAQDAVRKKKDEIARMNTDLYEFKNVAVTNKSEVKARDQKLAELKKKLKSAEHDLRARQLDYEARTTMMDSRFRDYLNETNKTQANYRAQIKALQQTLLKEQKEFAAVKDKSVLSDYKIAEREKKIAEKGARIAELKDAISDLGKELMYLQTRASGAVARPARPAGESAAEKERVVFIKKQDKLIAELKEQLILARQRSSSDGLDQRRADNDQRIVELKEELSRMEGQLSKQQDSIQSKESDFSTLQEQLKDAQERAGLLEKVIQQRDTQIADLEKQLNESLPTGIE